MTMGCAWPQSRRLATEGPDQRAQIYNVAWSPSDRELAATGSDGAVIIVTRPMHTSDAWTQRIAFKGDGSVRASRCCGSVCMLTRDAGVWLQL